MFALSSSQATSLSIGAIGWELTQRMAGAVTLSTASGATAELVGASVDVAAYVNGVPVHVLRLCSSVDAWGIGKGLPLAELEWVESEISEYSRET